LSSTRHPQLYARDFCVGKLRRLRRGEGVIPFLSGTRASTSFDAEVPTGRLKVPERKGITPSTRGVLFGKSKKIKDKRQKTKGM
jgi:hypothetical protein